MKTETAKDKWRNLASQGYGDDVIYDQAGNKWIVFRIHNPKLRPITDYQILVKEYGGSYTDVEVEY